MSKIDQLENPNRVRGPLRALPRPGHKDPIELSTALMKKAKGTPREPKSPITRSDEAEETTDQHPDWERWHQRRRGKNMGGDDEGARRGRGGRQRGGWRRGGSGSGGGKSA